MAMGQEDKEGEGQEVSSAHSLPMHSPQVQEDQATILQEAPQKPWSPRPPKSPWSPWSPIPSLATTHPVEMGQEDQEGEGQDLSLACPVPKEGQEMGEIKEIVLQISTRTSFHNLEKTFPVAMGQEDQESPQKSLPAAHPVRPQVWQVETHPPSLLAPSPQEQELQMEMGRKSQEDQGQADAQASACLLGQGQVGGEEIILEESFTPASSQVPSPLCLALGQEDPEAGWQSDACATSLQEGSWTLVQDEALVLAPSESRSPLQESPHSLCSSEVPEAPTQQGSVPVEMGQGHQEEGWQEVS